MVDEICTMLKSGITFKNYKDRFDNYLDIERNTPHIDVLKIKTDNFIEIGDSGTARYLPETGNTRIYRYAPVMPFFVFVYFVGSGRTGSHQRHFATQDINKLWQFIE